MLRPYPKIWEWELIFGRAVKVISSPGICSPWFKSTKPLSLSTFQLQGDLLREIYFSSAILDNSDNILDKDHFNNANIDFLNKKFLFSTGGLVLKKRKTADLKSN